MVVRLKINNVPEISDRTVFVLLLVVLFISAISVSVYVYSLNSLTIIRHVQFPTPINQDHQLSSGGIVSIRILPGDGQTDLAGTPATSRVEVP